MKIDRRKLLGGAAASALSTPAHSQFAIFQLGGTASPPPPPAGGGFGAPQLQVSGMFATINTTFDEANVQKFWEPGNEAPAISTADYYHMNACQFLKPYDLDSMGSPGATVKAANGGNRYVWFTAAEHPLGALQRDSAAFKMGFSDDPGVFPPVMVGIIPLNNQWTGDSTTPGADGETVRCGMAPSSLVYNPDDASFPFYLYVQGVALGAYTYGGGTQGIVWKSSDLFDWVGAAWGPKDFDYFGPLTSYQLVFRHGTGDWSTFGIVNYLGYTGPGKWTSTDGLTWTYASTTYNVPGFPSVNLSADDVSETRLTSASPIFDISQDGYGFSLINPTTHAMTGVLGKIQYISTTEIATGFTFAPVGFGPFLPVFTNEQWPFSFGPISYRLRSHPDFVHLVAYGILGAYGVPFTPGDSSQLYQTCVGDAATYASTDHAKWVALAPCDANFNIDQVVEPIQVSVTFNGFYPGPGTIVGLCDYQEDGINHIYSERIFPGPFDTFGTPYVGATFTGEVGAPSAGVSLLTVDSLVGYIPIGGFVVGDNTSIGQISKQNTGTPNGAGTYDVENINGVTVAAHTAGCYVNTGGDYITGANGGYTQQQLVDYYTIAYDSAAAARAAPFGVSASCSNNTVTISWMDTPLEMGSESQGYNVYRGTTSGSQTTQVGTTTSMLSVTDTPTPGQQYWYKVVKVSGGVEYASANRVVHTYVG